MKVILRPRKSGKTTEAVRLANEADAILVVTNQDIAKILASKCKLKYKPITFDELLEGRLRGHVCRKVIIDDADLLFRFLLDNAARGGRHFDIEAITWSDT